MIDHAAGDSTTTNLFNALCNAQYNDEHSSRLSHECHVR